MLKRDEGRVRTALHLVRCALAFIQEDTTVLAIESKVTALPENSYISGTGRRIVVITKTCGSRLHYLDIAVGHLEALLAHNDARKEREGKDGHVQERAQAP